MEGLNQALIECVKAAGGSAIVGKKVFPEKSPDSAQRALLDCLNEDRPAKFAPEQVLLVLRLAREKGHHGGVAFILSDLGYAPTTPIGPEDEVAELQRLFIESVAEQKRNTERMERVAARLGLRAVA
jgi:tRNA(Ile2) C34 agmatinyltransferase TiaS